MTELAEEKKDGIPDFRALVALIGILAISYLVLRRRDEVNVHDTSLMPEE